MTTPHHDHGRADIALAHLSDDAARQIHDFICYCLDLFEARDGDQIHRYYQDRSRDNLLQPPDPPNWGGLPF